MNLLRKYALLGLMPMMMWACADNDKLDGDSHFRQGQYEQAIDAYDKELNLKPGNVQLLYSRGRAHEELNNYDAAQEDFQKALKQDDRNVRVLIAMGDVLYKQQKFDNALYYYEQATGFEPSNAMALFKEGRAHHKLGNVKEALAKYDAAIREKDSMGEAYLYRGAIKVSQKKNKDACNDFLKAQTLNVAEASDALGRYCN